MPDISKFDVYRRQDFNDFGGKKMGHADEALRQLMAKIADLLDEDHFHACEEIVRRAGITPDGWQLVPKVPTDKMMILGGFSFAGKVPNEQVFPEVLKLWDKMLTEAAKNAPYAACPAKAEAQS